MKQGSNQAIRFFVMETLKDMYRGGDPNKKVPKMVVGAFGAVAGNIKLTNFLNTFPKHLNFFQFSKIPTNVSLKLLSCINFRCSFSFWKYPHRCSQNKDARS